VLFAAALLHDVGKPDRTRLEADGRITSRGHALRGSILARRRLWSLGVPFGVREQVTALVRHHMRPFYLLERDDSQRLAIEISQTARCSDLALLAEADARGRIAPDVPRLLDNVGLFAEFCREQGCLESPRPFTSEQARFLYFQDAGRHPDSPAHEDFRSEAVLLSGLPGSGKDHWIAAHLPHWPLISLDALRDELDIAPTDTQGPVLARARELAREYLRQGRSFVWNATNISRQLRRESVRLFAGYGARVRIVYVEVPEADLHRPPAESAARPFGCPGGAGGGAGAVPGPVGGARRDRGPRRRVGGAVVTAGRCARTSPTSRCWLGSRGRRASGKVSRTPGRKSTG
jgi:hypothetical protein